MNSRNSSTSRPSTPTCALEAAVVARQRLREARRILDELDQALLVQTAAERHLVVVDGLAEALQPRHDDAVAPRSRGRRGRSRRRRA